MQDSAAPRRAARMRSGACTFDRLGLVERDVLVVHGHALLHEGTAPLLYRLYPLHAEGLFGREIEAEAVCLDLGPFLVRLPVPQHAPQRQVEQVRRRVVGAECPPPALVDVEGHGAANAHPSLVTSSHRSRPVHSGWRSIRVRSLPPHVRCNPVGRRLRVEKPTESRESPTPARYFTVWLAPVCRVPTCMMYLSYEWNGMRGCKGKGCSSITVSGVRGRCWLRRCTHGGPTYGA